MRPASPRPAGAANYLRWRRSIDEHLELRRISFPEYGMLSWLCTKADPQTGRVRTNWLTLAQQTGLSANHVEKLVRSLRDKGYVEYPVHGGSRRVLVDVAIDKFPLADGSYTALGGRGGAGQAELPAELEGQTPAISLTSLGGRSRERERERSNSLSLRVSEADADPTAAPEAQSIEAASTPAGSRAEALAQAPAVLRETVELFFLKTGRHGLDAGELAALRDLERAHTPAVIQRAISAAVARFAGRGQSPAELTVAYVQQSLKYFATRRAGSGVADPGPSRAYRDGVTPMELTDPVDGRAPVARGR